MDAFLAKHARVRAFAQQDARPAAFEDHDGGAAAATREACEIRVAQHINRNICELSALSGRNAAEQLAAHHPLCTIRCFATSEPLRDTLVELSQPGTHVSIWMLGSIRAPLREALLRSASMCKQIARWSCVGCRRLTDSTQASQSGADNSADANFDRDAAENID